MNQRTFLLRDARSVNELRSLLRDWPRHAAMDRPLAVTVAEWKARRNVAQNRLLHHLLGQIADGYQPGGVQYDVDFWRELVKQKFIGSEEMRLPDGSVVSRGLSTTSLTVGEFADLIDRVSHWAVTELQIDLD